MKVIDIHSHFNLGLEHDMFNQSNHKHNRTFEFQKYNYDTNRLYAGGFSPFSSVFQTECIFKHNQVLNEYTKKYDWLYQWVVLDPRQEDLYAQVRELIKDEKVLGIKIHSPNHKYDIEEYGDKIFSFANELKCFVMMHNDKIDKMPHFANKYPDMNLIIAHLGRDDAFEEAILSAKHGNIYTDTSGSASSMNNVIENAVKKVGSEKIFFGMDTYAFGFQYGRIKYANISEEDKENIFYKNALKHFNIK